MAYRSEFDFEIHYSRPLKLSLYTKGSFKTEKKVPKVIHDLIRIFDMHSEQLLSQPNKEC